MIGLVIEATGPAAAVGELCSISSRAAAASRSRPRWSASARAARCSCRSARCSGIGPGNRVIATGRPFELAGRRASCSAGSLDGLGRPIDGGLPLRVRRAPRRPPRAARRRSARRGSTTRLPLGVRALDALVPCGQGQRLGIFAGSGVGKSSLLGMIARSTQADVNVICLVGERGREVREFIERDLGDGLERSVVIVATSDEPALVRIAAAFARRRSPRLSATAARRAADDGLGHPLRDGPARGRPRHRRAAGHARLHAVASSRCCRACWSAPARASAARSPGSTPCSSRATT